MLKDQHILIEFFYACIYILWLLSSFSTETRAKATQQTHTKTAVSHFFLPFFFIFSCRGNSPINLMVTKNNWRLDSGKKNSVCFLKKNEEKRNYSVIISYRIISLFNSSTCNEKNILENEIFFLFFDFYTHFFITISVYK